MNITEFEKLPILSILRGIRDKHLGPVIQTTIECGLKALEITLNTPGALTLIKSASIEFEGKIYIGAGTVLTIKDAKKAIEAGASFLVSPNFNAEIAKYCNNSRIPFFPGALTPSEIYAAWESGAAMVKVFPAGLFGPGYFKEIKGPFDRIKAMAVGGVTAGNVAEYFASGADAVAIGAGVYKKEWIENEEYDKIGSLINEYISNYSKGRSK